MSVGPLNKGSQSDSEVRYSGGAKCGGIFEQQ
jgi:hypothetical protein